MVFLKLKIVEISINMNVLRNKIKLFVLKGNFLDNKMVNIFILFNVLLFLRVRFMFNLIIILLIIVISSELFLIIVGI